MCVVKKDNKTYIYMVEVCNTKKFDIKKYKKLKEGNTWKNVFPMFPTIIVISDKIVDNDEKLNIINFNLNLNNFNL